MPLTKEKAKKLFDLTVLAEVEPWVNALSTPLDTEDLNTNEALQAKLIELREASLDRKSYLIDLDGKKVRVYPAKKTTFIIKKILVSMPLIFTLADLIQHEPLLKS